MTSAPNWREVARPFLNGEAIPGRINGRSGMRNNTLCSLAGRLRFEGHEREVIEAVLLEVNRTRCVPPMSVRSVRSIAQWIAKKPPGPGRGMIPRSQFDAARDALVELACCFIEFEWRGRGAMTDRDVVRALLRIAWECGRLTFDASERRVAECAEVGRPAVQRALTKSQAVRAWVRRVRGKRVRGTSSTWQLRRPRGVRPSDTNNAGNAALCLLVSDCRTGDVWRYSGLGKSARHVWDVLAAQPLPSARAIATACSLTPRSVQRVLVRLQAHGLAARDADGWRRGPVEPDDVAPMLRSYGAGERQRQRHKDEREQYEDNRARLLRRRVRLALVAGTPKDDEPDPQLGLAHDAARASVRQLPVVVANELSAGITPSEPPCPTTDDVDPFFAVPVPSGPQETSGRKPAPDTVPAGGDLGRGGQSEEPDTALDIWSAPSPASRTQSPLECEASNPTVNLGLGDGTVWVVPAEAMALDWVSAAAEMFEERLAIMLDDAGVPEGVARARAEQCTRAHFDRLRKPG